MKKTFKLFAIALMAIGLASCGGKKDSEKAEEKEKPTYTLSPETTKVKGDLGKYFTVVEKEYTTTNDWNDMITVEVERTDVPFEFDIDGTEPMGTHGKGVTGNAGFGIEILDENGNVIEKSSATTGGLGGMYSSDDMKDALKLQPGETATVRWTFSFDPEKKPAKFRLTSAFEKVTPWEESSSDDDSESSSSYSSSDDDDSESSSVASSSSSSGSEDWDAILNSYDSYVTKYISYVKKASNGDMSALAEYPALMQEAQELSDKLSNAKSELSSKQWARYMKITNKMASAAASM